MEKELEICCVASSSARSFTEQQKKLYIRYIDMYIYYNMYINIQTKIATA